MALLKTRIVGGWADLAPNDIDQAVVKGAVTLTILTTNLRASSRCRVMIETTLTIEIILHTITSFLAREVNGRPFFRFLFLLFREVLGVFFRALVSQVEHGVAGSRRTFLFRKLVDCPPSGQLSLSVLSSPEHP